MNKINYILNLKKTLYADTKKYQKKYGFKVGKGKEDTHNNEVDALKYIYF